MEFVRGAGEESQRGGKKQDCVTLEIRLIVEQLWLEWRNALVCRWLGKVAGYILAGQDHKYLVFYILSYISVFSKKPQNKTLPSAALVNPLK